MDMHGYRTSIHIYIYIYINIEGGVGCKYYIPHSYPLKGGLLVFRVLRGICLGFRVLGLDFAIL